MEIKIMPYKRSPHYYETDMMGVVHHSNYIRWFEEARLDLMDQAGFPYKKMEDMGVLIPIINVECHYNKFIKFGDQVSIVTKIESFNGVRMNMSYEIYDKEEFLCISGKSSHCFVNNNLQVIRLKKDNLDIFNFFQSLLYK